MNPKEVNPRKVLKVLAEHLEKAKHRLSIGWKLVASGHVRQGERYLNRAMRHLAYAQRLLKEVER
jgi:hypothetical protein